MEPKLIYATMRDGVNDVGEDCIDICCRFDDGQKFDTVQVDSNFPHLAEIICEHLNAEVRHPADKKEGEVNGGRKHEKGRSGV